MVRRSVPYSFIAVVSAFCCFFDEHSLPTIRAAVACPGVPAISWTFPLCCFWCPIVKLALVIRWAYLAEPTLFPDVIVISLDVVEHGGPDLARVAPHVLIDQLLLDRRIKRFRCRVVVAYAGVPDRRDNTLGEKAIAVPSRGILGTAVMVR